jgi:uncharacterized membrane protein
MLRDNAGRFAGSAEELILRVGLWFFVVFLLCCHVAVRVAPPIASGMAYVFTYHMLGGRAAGILAGLDHSLPHLIAVVQITFTDVALMFIVHPVVVLTVEHGKQWWIVRVTVSSTISAARKGGTRLRRWGVVGIAIFVGLPLYMTGPLVGSTIGYLIGLKWWANMTAVSGGLLLSSTMWLVLFHQMHQLVESYAEGVVQWLPPLFVALTAMAFIASLIYRNLRRRGGKAAAEEGAAPSAAVEQ